MSNATVADLYCSVVAARNAKRYDSSVDFYQRLLELLMTQHKAAPEGVGKKQLWRRIESHMAEAEGVRGLMAATLQPEPVPPPKPKRVPQSVPVPVPMPVTLPHASSNFPLALLPPPVPAPFSRESGLPAPAPEAVHKPPKSVGSAALHTGAIMGAGAGTGTVAGTEVDDAQTLGYQPADPPTGDPIAKPAPAPTPTIPAPTPAHTPAPVPTTFRDAPSAPTPAPASAPTPTSTPAPASTLTSALGRGAALGVEVGAARGANMSAGAGAAHRSPTGSRAQLGSNSGGTQRTAVDRLYSGGSNRTVRGSGGRVGTPGRGATPGVEAGAAGGASMSAGAGAGAGAGGAQRAPTGIRAQWGSNSGGSRRALGAARGVRGAVPRVAGVTGSTGAGASISRNSASAPRSAARPATEKQEGGDQGASRSASSSSASSKGGGAGEGGGELEDQILSNMLDHSPQIRWDDIAGLGLAKQTLQEAVILPALRPDLFTGLRAPPKGVLLFGPPGTGKTMLAKAVASESDCTFFCISASAVTSKYMGEGEKLMKTLFCVARQRQPSVLFFDEIDALLSARKEGEHEASRRIKTEFMTQVDGASTCAGDRLLVMAATNLPWAIDEAALRRLARRIYVPMPDAQTRAALLQLLLNKPDDAGLRPGGGGGGGLCGMGAAQLQRLVQQTEGYSGSDLTTLCQEAALGPIRELGPEALKTVRVSDVRPLSEQDFLGALRTIRCSVSSKSLAELQAWAAQFGAAI